ncbi:MAG: nitroreductase [Syntrophomonadaceae bacterium]|nr:nitroreductase [Syntrophomonadaceae bacterium]
MDFFEVVKGRYSVRGYQPDAVEPEKIRNILEAARIAPTASNRQAFRIIVIETEKNRDKLKQIYGREWFTEAPVTICVCSIPNASWVRGDGKNYSDVDAAIVMDHIILAATALGLGTCWIAAFDASSARELLDLDDAWEPVAFTPLGYRRAGNPNRTKKSLEELVIYK